jgi:nitroreductase
VKKVDPIRTPERRTIEVLIEAATWAPNHHLTEPWRFVVIAGEERRQLGDAMAHALREKMRTDDPRLQEVLVREVEKAFRAPLIIAVISSVKEDTSGKIIPQEEMIAAGAALQNLLLATHALGLGAIVRTGPHAYLGPVRSYLGLKEKENLVGFVYIGYPDGSPGSSKRTAPTEKIEWRGI